MKEEGSQHKFEVENSQEGQEYAPRLEPAALIRQADRNNAHYPSRHCTILTPFFLSCNNIVQLTPWIRCLNQHWLPFREQKGVFQLAPWIWCFKCTWQHLPMTPVWIESCVLEVRH